MTTVTLPDGTWDTHVHVFEPDCYPYVAARSYTPGRATLKDLERRHRQWGVDRCVLVQPSVYGTNNACLLDALATLGARAHAVAVVDPTKVTDETLADYLAAGVAGMRVNLIAGSDPQASDSFSRMAKRLRGSGMFVQIYAPLATIVARRAEIEEAGVPVILDHFAGICEADRKSNVATLTAMCRTAPIWIKLSADYRIGHDGNLPETWAIDFVQHLWSFMPDRLIWGSDWPHTGGGATRKARALSEIEPFRKVYALSVLQILADAGLDDAACERILVTNPGTLFDRADADRTPSPNQETDTPIKAI